MQFVDHIKFSVLPQISQFYFEDEYNLNDAVSTTCSVTKGDLPLDIWWTFREIDGLNEKKLSTNDGVVISRPNAKLSLLSIEAVKGRHRGNYTCIVSNKAGTIQYSAQLAINGS